MVAKKPADRYQTASDVITDLVRSRTVEEATNIPVARSNEAQELNDFLAVLAGAQAAPERAADVRIDLSQLTGSQQVDSAKTETAGASTSIRRTRSSKSKAARRHPRHAVSIVTGPRILLLVAGIVIMVIAIALFREWIKDVQDQPVRPMHPPETVQLRVEPSEDSKFPPVFVGDDFSKAFNGSDLKNWTEVGTKTTWKVSQAALRGGSAAWLLYDNKEIPGDLIQGGFELGVEVRVPKGGAGEILIGARKDRQPGEFLKVCVVPGGEGGATPVKEQPELVQVAVTAESWTQISVRVEGGYATVWPGRRRIALSKSLSGGIGLSSPKQSVAFRGICLRRLGDWAKPSLKKDR